MTTIPLTRGQVAIVDDVDADLALVKWYAYPVGRRGFYARRCVGTRERKWVKLHQVIAKRLGCELVDHKNRDGLDNRRENLRPATKRQNAANHGRNRNNASGYKGVSWCNRERKWRACIRVDYKRKSLGYYADPAEAARAYDAAAAVAFGEFAALNFPLHPAEPETKR